MTVCPEGCLNDTWILNIPAHRYDSRSDRLTGKRTPHVNKRVDVGYDNTYIWWYASLWDRSPGYLIYQYVFIPRRVGIDHCGHLNPRDSRGLFLDYLLGLGHALPQGDITLTCSGGEHHYQEPVKDLIGAGREDMAIGLDKGFAFATVCDHDVGTRPRLHMRGEPCTTGTDDAGI